MMGTVVMLTPTDSVKDRLAAYYHWNDPQALEQALMVAKAQKINLREVKRWSEEKGHTGCRMGEILSVTWKDNIDMNRMIITILRA